MICHVFFKSYGILLGLISERTIRFGFSLRSVDQKNIQSNFFSATCVPEKPLILSLVFLGVGYFDARYFFGSKISGLCIFLGLQYEAPSDPPPPPPPPVKYTSSIPSGGSRFLFVRLPHYGGISMTKFNTQKLKKNHRNRKCINPKLNGNKPILKIAITQTGITQIGKTQTGIAQKGISHKA